MPRAFSVSLPRLYPLFKIIKLVRAVPLVVWSGGSFVIGLSWAVTLKGVGGFPWGSIILICLVIFLLHGVSAHGWNDLSDWESGTDSNSDGILSGGSGLLTAQELSPVHISFAVKTATFLSLLAALWLGLQAGWPAILYLLVGIWSGWAYSMPPLRLSYRPFLGEWLTGMPSLVAVGTAPVLLTATPVGGPLIWAVSLHGLFSLGWLMQHHIPDIAADMAARPAKVTTTAWVRSRYGLPAAVYAPAGYYVLAALAGIVAGFWHRILWGSLLFSITGMALALYTNPMDIADTTLRQKQMLLAGSFHALYLAWAIYNLA